MNAATVSPQLLHVLSLYTIQWIVEEPGALPASLRRKLICSVNQMETALRALSATEFQQVRDAVTEVGTTRNLPGPLELPTIQQFLNGVRSRSARAALGED